MSSKIGGTWGSGTYPFSTSTSREKQLQYNLGTKPTELKDRGLINQQSSAFEVQIQKY